MPFLGAIHRSGGVACRRGHSLFQASRWSSSFVRTPPASAPREVPTPLLFVSSKEWDIDSEKGVEKLATMLSMKGFTCVHCDISLPAVHSSAPPLNSDQLMHRLVEDLKANLRLSSHAVSFPPVLFARSAASLIAQAYISSNPVTAMMLMGRIPSTNAEVVGSLLPTPLAEFNFEPKFPIALLSTPREMERLWKTNRLAQAGVDLLPTEDLESQDAFEKIEGWLDELGI
ncbi:hypothetical protein MVEN_01909200 [Mycena venus]|uniref:Uncharacterized protein n=1 Tax=Mycena venus TaxID=2733690 RepID=A0A8H6XF28_9AGAR|nr:hypothetical protein MVEN_01909200 [Mycena venus]